MNTSTENTASTSNTKTQPSPKSELNRFAELLDRFFANIAL